MTGPLFISMLEEVYVPRTPAQLRLALEIELSWLRHFSFEEKKKDIESVRLLTEDDFIQAAFDCFSLAQSGAEMKLAAALFPDLMERPIMANIER